MPLPENPTPEEREMLVAAEDLERLVEQPGWARFKDSILSQLVMNYDSFLSSSESDLVKVQTEARTLWNVLGGCDRGITQGNQVRVLLQTRHEASVQNERGSARYSEAFLRSRMRGVRGPT